jgi:hypothetical protein
MVAFNIEKENIEERMNPIGKEMTKERHQLYYVLACLIERKR